MGRYDLVVLGDCNPDLILAGNTAPVFGEVEQIVEAAQLTIGGSGSITAAGAARLGLAVALVAVVGDDRLGRIQLESLADRGVDVSHVIVDPDAHTGVTVILEHDGDRAILTSPGAIDSLTVERADRAMLCTSRHVHVSSYFLQRGLRPGLPELFRDLRTQGVTTSVDTNWDPSGTFDDGLAELLGEVDCLFLNESEARHVTSADTVEAALDALAGRVQVAVVKRGAAGAAARSRTEHAGAGAVAVDVADTTGAGDSFAAGFLAGWLSGARLADALALGCACGSLSARALGGVNAQPTLQEARVYLRITP